jgi:hypothetical protein
MLEAAMGLAKSIKKPKVFVPVVILLLIAAAVGFAFKNMNSPAQGTVTTPLTDNPTSLKSTALYKKYSDKFISFQYPGSYQLNPSAKDSGSLDSVSLISTSPRDKFIAISVVNGSFANDSGMSFRRSHLDIYKIVSDTPAAVIFQKTDQTEYTGYLQKGGKDISISFTGVAAQDFSQDYQTIAGSIQTVQ